MGTLCSLERTFLGRPAVEPAGEQRERNLTRHGASRSKISAFDVITVTLGRPGARLRPRNPRPYLRKNRIVIGLSADAPTATADDDRLVTFQADTFRRSHAALLKAADSLVTTARQLHGASPHVREHLLSEALTTLHDNVLPYIKRDEKALYPEIVKRFDDSLALDFMKHDRAVISNWIDRLAAASLDDSPELEKLLYGLHALISVHVAREKQLYLDTLESSSWPTDG